MPRPFLRWTVSNTPAMNIHIIAILAAGFYSAIQLRYETFPEFDIEIFESTLCSYRMTFNQAANIIRVENVQ
jgi:hypothetical protein